MRIKSVTIKDFKRFTDLTVQGIPETVRLIMLAGPNGSGKSSFFDALHTWHRWTSQKARHGKPITMPKLAGLTMGAGTIVSRQFSFMNRGTIRQKSPCT